MKKSGKKTVNYGIFKVKYLLLLLFFSPFISDYIETNHFQQKSIEWLTEAGMTLIIGITLYIIYHQY